MDANSADRPAPGRGHGGDYPRGVPRTVFPLMAERDAAGGPWYTPDADAPSGRREVVEVRRFTTGEPAPWPVPADPDCYFKIVRGEDGTKREHRVVAFRIALLAHAWAGAATSKALIGHLKAYAGAHPGDFTAADVPRKSAAENYLAAANAPTNGRGKACLSLLAAAFGVDEKWLIDPTALDAPAFKPGREPPAVPPPPPPDGRVSRGPRPRKVEAADAPIIDPGEDDEMETLMAVLQVLNLDFKTVAGELLGADPPTAPLTAPTDAQRRTLERLAKLGFSPAVIVAHLAETGRLTGR